MHEHSLVGSRTGLLETLDEITKSDGDVTFGGTSPPFFSSKKRRKEVPVFHSIAENVN